MASVRRIKKVCVCARKRERRRRSGRRTIVTDAAGARARACVCVCVQLGVELFARASERKIEAHCRAAPRSRARTRNWPRRWRTIAAIKHSVDREEEEERRAPARRHHTQAADLKTGGGGAQPSELSAVLVRANTLARRAPRPLAPPLAHAHKCRRCDDTRGGRPRRRRPKTQIGARRLLRRAASERASGQTDAPPP